VRNTPLTNFLGEIMLRLDPGRDESHGAGVQAWEGGGEYNVSRGLRKCFGLKTAVCTAFVTNEVGHLIEDFIMQGGVARTSSSGNPMTALGGRCANGLNFTGARVRRPRWRRRAGSRSHGGSQLSG